MRKEPKNQSRAAYESYYGEAKSRKHDYEYDSQYSYNYDYNDSYYQTSEDWNYSKDQNTDYINYKLPQKYKDNHKKWSETIYPSTAKSGYKEYNCCNEKNTNDKNPHKTNKHQYSPKGNSGYQGKLNNKSSNSKLNEGHTHPSLNPEVNNALPLSNCNFQSKQKINAQDKSKQSKDSIDCKLNNNLGNIKPTLSVNGESKKFNTQERLVEVDAKIFSGDVKMTSKSSNSNSNCRKVPKKKNKAKHKTEVESVENSKANKIIKETNKIEELSSDIEKLDDANMINQKLKIHSLPQYQAPVYIVSPVINLNQIPISQIIGNNLGYIPQYVQPITQPGVILNSQNQMLGSRATFPNQHYPYLYETNGGHLVNNGYAHNVTSSDLNMIRFSGGQPQMILPSYNQNLVVRGNNYCNMQQNYSSHEQPFGMNKALYSGLGYPLQMQSEFQNKGTLENQQVKDTLPQYTFDKYVSQTRINNQANSQTPYLNNSQNQCVSNGAWTSESEQLLSQPQIHSLLLGPKVSIRDQFAHKEECSNIQQKVQGLSNGFDNCGSTHNETEMLGHLGGGLDSEENDYDQLAFLQSLQSNQSYDHSWNKGVKDSNIPKEDFDDFDFKNAFHLNGISLATAPQYEDSKYRASPNFSPSYPKGTPYDFLSLSFDNDDPTETKNLKTEKHESQE